MKPVCVLSNIFCKPKDKVLDKISRALFIKCLVMTAMQCIMYIGETGRSLETRKRQHIDAVKIFDMK